MAVTTLPFRFPGIAGVRVAFQTRCGGFSQGDYGGGNVSLHTEDDPQAVAKNREALGRTLGLARMADVYQVHGGTTIFEPEAVEPHQKPGVEADGMATAQAGLGLAIKSADCQPVLLSHNSGRYIAALHVGWRGNRIAYPTTAVREFCAFYGIAPQDVLAVRGPSLSPPAAEFVNFASEWGDNFRPWFNPHTQTMDLWALTRHQLEAAGLLPGNIYGLDLCTYGNPESFFSYRRVAASGRQASVIWIEPSNSNARSNELELESGACHSRRPKPQVSQGAGGLCPPSAALHEKRSFEVKLV